MARSFSPIVVLISFLVHGEKLTELQALGVLLTLVGVAFASFKTGDLKTLNHKNLLGDKGLKCALISMVSWGVYFALVKIPVSSIGWFWPTYAFNLMFILLLIYSRTRKIGLSLKKDKKSFLSHFHLNAFGITSTLSGILIISFL